MLATGWKSLEQLQLLLPHDLLLVSKSKKTLKFASNQFTLEGLSHALHVVRETDVEIEAMCDSNNSCLRCEFSNGAGNYKLCPWKNSSRSLRSAPPPNHPLGTQSILLCLQWVTNPESETRKLNDNFIANQDKIVIIAATNPCDPWLTKRLISNQLTRRPSYYWYFPNNLGSNQCKSVQAI